MRILLLNLGMDSTRDVKQALSGQGYEITTDRNLTVDEILAPRGHVEGVRIRNPQTKELGTIPLDGVFVAIGHDPNTIVFKGKLEMDSNGYLLAKHGSLTAVPGVFVAGDVQDHRYRQAVTAAGSGCMAAIDAEKFLEEHKH